MSGEEIDTLKLKGMLAQDTSFTESFTQWLDNKGDALAAPDSFDQWLKQNEDSI